MASVPDIPAALLDHLRSRTRTEAINEHSVDVRVGWWNERERSLPGGPVAGAGSAIGTQPITRADLFTLSVSAVEDETGTEALRLLWHTLAWGSGLKNRNNKRRIASVLSDSDGAGRLRRAAVTARSDPAEAFAILRPGRRNTFDWLGPNFFTKYLYFAGGGHPEHPCLIVDQFVRATLYCETGQDPRFAHVSQYSVAAYLGTLEELGLWALEASSLLGRHVAADEIEKWAFSAR